VPPGSEQAAPVDIAVGTGTITLQPNAARFYHFRLAAPSQSGRPSSLSYYWVTDRPVDASVELQLWMPLSGWLSLKVSPGYMPVYQVRDIVLPHGDFYVRLRNTSEKPLLIENFGFHLTITQPDGLIQFYGIDPPD
jgi:hypothetical protein